MLRELLFSQNIYRMQFFNNTHKSINNHMRNTMAPISMSNLGSQFGRVNRDGLLFLNFAVLFFETFNGLLAEVFRSSESETTDILGMESVQSTTFRRFLSSLTFQGFRNEVYQATSMLLLKIWVQCLITGSLA